jgi:transposase
MPQIYKREEVDLDSYTMAGWIGKSTALLEPLADTIKKHVLKGQAVFADDMPVKMPAPDSGKPGPHGFGPMFATKGPGPERRILAAWYQFSLDRKGVRPREHLLDYEGFKKHIREFLRIKGLLSECGNNFFNFNGVQSLTTPRLFVEPSN